MKSIPKWLTTRPIAHRGLHDGNIKIPENSIASFTEAIKNNYPIELDIQLISDGTIIVFHDYDLKRICGSTLKTKKISLTVLKKFHLFSTQENIPTLQEVFDLVKGKVPILIELKTNTRFKNLEKRLLHLLKNYRGDIALQSFNRSSVRWLSRHCPSYFIGQLAEPSQVIQPLNRIYDYLQLNTRMNPDFIAYDIDDLPNKRVHYFKKKGTPVLLWTVRKQAQIEKHKSIFTTIIFEGFIPKI